MWNSARLTTLKETEQILSLHEIWTCEQVHDHCNYWIDTTQSIQWISVTQPNLVEEKLKCSELKPLLKAQSSPGQTKYSNPPIRQTPWLSNQEIRQTEENLEDHDYIGRTNVKALQVHTTMVEINRQGLNCELKTGVQTLSNFLHIRISSNQCGTKMTIYIK